MSGPLVALVLTTGVAVVVTLVLVARASLTPGAYVVRRSAERPCVLLSARLVPSHRELPGRPPAARRERQVYRITDCPGATGARASERKGNGTRIPRM